MLLVAITAVVLAHLLNPLFVDLLLVLPQALHLLQVAVLPAAALLLLHLAVAPLLPLQVLLLVVLLPVLLAYV